MAKRHPDSVHEEDLSRSQGSMSVIPLYWTLTAKQQDIVNSQMLAWKKELAAGKKPDNLSINYTPPPSAPEPPVTLDDLTEDYIEEFGVHPDDHEE